MSIPPVTVSRSSRKQRLPPCPACCAQNTVVCLSRTLLQKCKPVHPPIKLLMSLFKKKIINKSTSPRELWGLIGSKSMKAWRQNICDFLSLLWSFLFFLFHFLSFNIWPLRARAGLRLVWIWTLLRFREIVIFASYMDPRYSWLSDQSNIPTLLQGQSFYMLFWTLNLSFFILTGPYWEDPQNDGLVLVKS